MQATDDMALLREFAERHSEAAFEELVNRRIGFVYAAALRQVREPLLAEEITQAVFILLAQKAAKIPGKTILTGWLFKTTRFTALAQIRAAARRSLRTATIEKELQMQTEFQSAAADEIWNQMSPLLDEALAALGEKDRQAVLLRFFENKSLAEVGRFLGTGEDTARKRVSRALEKLHRYFNRRGISSTTAIIAGEISANSIQPVVPVALAKSVTAAALAKGTAASTSTLTLIKGALKIMAWTKAKTAIIAGVTVILAATSTTIVGIKLARPHRAAVKPLAGLSPVMLSVTADIEANGAVHGVATVNETNGTDQTILTDHLDNEEGSIIRATDEFGQAMRFTREGRGYLITLNKPVPRGGKTAYTLEEQLAPGILETDDVIKAIAPDIREFRMASIIGNDFNMRCMEAWRLPPGATLLEKDANILETTNAGRIELRFDRIIPPEGRLTFGFRYRLATGAK